jgi:hypothetical protein
MSLSKRIDSRYFSISYAIWALFGHSGLRDLTWFEMGKPSLARHIQEPFPDHSTCLIREERHALLQGTLRGTLPFTMSPIPHHFGHTPAPLAPLPNTVWLYPHCAPRREMA